MNAIDNLNYFYILEKKNQVLENYYDNKENSIIIPIECIVTLFVIDHSNIKYEYYNDDELKIIKDFVSIFLKDEKITQTFTSTELKKIIKFSRLKRIPNDLNKAIVLKIAQLYNKNKNNLSLIKINLLVLEKICDQL